MYNFPNKRAMPPQVTLTERGKLVFNAAASRMLAGIFNVSVDYEKDKQRIVVFQNDAGSVVGRHKAYEYVISAGKHIKATGLVTKDKRRVHCRAFNPAPGVVVIELEGASV